MIAVGALSGIVAYQVTNRLGATAVEATKELAGATAFEPQLIEPFDPTIIRDLTPFFVNEITKTGAKIVRDVCITAVSLGTIYAGCELLRSVIKAAVTKAMGDERDDQDIPRIKPGSLHIFFRCFTDKRFLEVLADYESGKIKERLQKEFSEVGIEVEGMKLEIENMKEVEETRAAINKRYTNQYIALKQENLRVL